MNPINLPKTHPQPTLNPPITCHPDLLHYYDSHDASYLIFNCKCSNSPISFCMSARQFWLSLKTTPWWLDFIIKNHSAGHSPGAFVI